MLRIHQFSFNPFQENTYIISNDQNQCWFVDPGMSMALEQEQIVDYVTTHQLKPQAIINTHAHIDHILGIDYLAHRYQIPFFLHEKEIPILNNAAQTARMFGFPFEGVQTKPQFISEQTGILLGTAMIQIRFVPGHSPGSIALYAEMDQWVISGDALFAGSIGRTDLPMGDYDTLINSIKTQLLSLPDDTKVYSGHGPMTNIHTERHSNPFLS
jgi:hydroxyacylglutathione hydrolase